MKKYYSNWNAKKLIVNFNHKQWRQDIAAYIKEKLFWDMAIVTRVKTIDKNGLKMFEVINNVGKRFKVEYKNENNIKSAENIELVKAYLESRS